MKKQFFCIAIVALCMTSCKTQCIKTLENQSFTITELNGKPLEQTENEKPSISFKDNQVNATVGCNQIFAKYTAAKGGKLVFSSGGATKMLCPEQMREDEFIEAFNKVAHYTMQGRQILFYDSNNNLLFKGTK